MNVKHCVLTKRHKTNKIELINECPLNEPPHDKTNNVAMRPAKTQISLGIRPVWSESSLCAQWVAKDPSFLHANSEDSDQTGRMPRLIWVFAGRTVTLFVLSWGGSNVLLTWIILINDPVVTMGVARSIRFRIFGDFLSVSCTYMLHYFYFYLFIHFPIVSLL